MKTISILSAVILLSVFFSCQKDRIIDSVKENQPIVIEKISGFVQKGPFMIGTSITISELDSVLSQSGRNFNTQIINNNGNFEIRNITLNNSIVEIKADGFYFNEVKGTTSENKLTLYALSDLTDQSTINVNVLSSLEKPRIEYLVEGGKSFSEAKKQAQKEVLAIFQVEKENIANSEQLDLSKNGDDNAILLAISVILQGNRSVAELSELLAKIGLDIRTDGVLDDQTIGSQLINDSKMMDLSTIRSNIEYKYFLLGETDTIPDFESKVTNFIAKTNFVYTLKIEYPIEGKYGRSILSLDEGETISSPAHYSLKAIIPQGFNLKVKLRSTSDRANGMFVTTFFAGEVSSYELTPDNIVGRFEFTSKKDVPEADQWINFEGKGSGIIEIFENNSVTPTRTIHFNWGVPANPGIIYPDSGNFGQNIFAMKDNTLLKSGQTYSLAMTLPVNMSLTMDMVIQKTSGMGFLGYDKNLVENWSPYISDEKDFILANCTEPPYSADMPIIFSGKGECTIELKIRNGLNTTAMLKHFKWE